jgi:8-oxo-dGTP pyrophosphatase MutT (NUDIX family)
MIKPWKLIDSKIDRDYKVFKIKAITAISPRTNRAAEFYTIETEDWVNIIPITPDHNVVMIRQFRHGSKEVTLEIPGGLVEGEDPEKAALRELKEETGYAGDKILYLGCTNPNPAIFNNLCHTYLVEDAIEVSHKDLDPGEDIEVSLVPLIDIPRLINNGIINHALVVVAFHFYFSRIGYR